MIPAFVLPFIYSVILGTAWSLTFKKKFYSSLAPAYLAHIIIVLISGLLFKKLSIGIYLGIIIATLALILSIIKDKKVFPQNLREIADMLWKEGF